MTSISETAQNLIPGNDQARTILKSLGISRVINTVPVVRYEATEPAARAAVVAEIEKLLLAGKPIPDDIAEPVRLAHDADQNALARAEIIDATARRAWSTGHDIGEEDIKPALDYLRTELERVMTESADQAKHLNGITTAEQVINAAPAVTAAWNELTRLDAEYQEIRQVQRDLYRRVDQQIGKQQLTIADFTDAIDVDPYWVRRRQTNGIAQRGGHDGATAYAEWMISAIDRTPVWMDDNQPAALRMAAIRNVWIPDINTLWETYQAAYQATEIPSDYTVLDRIDDLNTYYQLTGATPSIKTVEFANVIQKPKETKTGTNHDARQRAARERVAERIGTPNNDPWHGKPSVPIGGWD